MSHEENVNNNSENNYSGLIVKNEKFTGLKTQC